ncbi:MAG: isopentenyldiphosphate isomerase [Parasphingorhabdus sp.]|jgi:isopentenyldiphosphate isomerase
MSKLKTNKTPAERTDKYTFDVSQELLDVVNTQDEVINTMTRGEIHRLALMHRAVHLMVFNRIGEIFLQKRSMLKDNNPGLWDSSVSGHVDAGETYDQSVVRETKEEIGVCLSQQPQWLFTLPATAATGYEFTAVYRCRHEGPFILHPQEIDEGRWFTTEKVEDWLQNNPDLLAESVGPIWDQLKDFLNKPF